MYDSTVGNLENRVLLQSIGIHASKYASIEAIHEDLDKLIAQHVNPTQQLSKNENSISLEDGNSPNLYPNLSKNFGILFLKFKRSLRRRGLIATSGIAFSFIQGKLKLRVSRFRIISSDKTSKSSRFREKRNQGAWYRLNTFPDSEIDLIEFHSDLDFGNSKNFNVALICTVLNEADGIREWLESLSAQTVKPNQLIIIDGGSSDTTVTEIQEFADLLKFKVTVEVIPKASPAVGRNSALDLVSDSVDFVLFVDAGCKYEPNFISHFVNACDLTSEPIAVAGTWRADSNDPRIARKLTPSWANWNLHDWNKYLPSARAFGLNRQALNLGIRFPEWLTMSGEDTAFMVECKQKIKNWKILVTPRVDWLAPRNEDNLRIVERRYALGDGESGVRDSVFNQLLQNKSRHLDHFKDGYMQGFRNRPMCDLKRGLKKVYIICSLTPIADSGGAQRTTQIAYELLRDDKNRVIFLSAEKSYESPDTTVDLTLDPTRLTLGFPEDPEILGQIKEYAKYGFRISVMIEAPHPAFLAFQEDLINGSSAQITFTYSEIDDWDGQLGGDWYDNEIRLKLANNSQNLSASAKVLATRLSAETGREVKYIPNAADSSLFNSSVLRNDETFDVVYAGGLWGTWFDWNSIFQVLKSHLELRFILLGDMDLWRRSLLQARFRNLYMPGIVKQTELPAIYAGAKVLLVPFLVNDITKATNPLKIHEYLLMDKAIVLSEMPEFENFKECSHLFFYGEKSKRSLNEALGAALQWDGHCPKNFVGHGGLHEGVFTWNSVIKLYSK
jgi:glycosyltransferase involved in cell wall biosynthesis